MKKVISMCLLCGLMAFLSCGVGNSFINKKELEEGLIGKTIYLKKAIPKSVLDYSMGSDFIFEKDHKVKITSPLYGTTHTALWVKDDNGQTGLIVIGDPKTYNQLLANLRSVCYFEPPEEYKQKMINAYGSKIGTKVFEGKVIIEMPKEAFLEVYPPPDEINRTVSASGIHEQWIYKQIGKMKDLYFYFDNGILTSWQD